MAGGLRRLVAVLLLVGLVGFSAACGSGRGGATDVGQAMNGTGSTGDTSPGELIEVGDEVDSPEHEPSPRETEEQALPDGPEQQESETEDTVRLEPLDQPDKDKAYPAPTMPEEPAEDAEELTHVSYALEVDAFKAAGVVYEDTETDCSTESEELRDTGTYEFTCTVSFAGVDVEYDVTAEVKEDTMPITFSTNRLPVSEDKAVYEATRQSFKPARVTCDVLGVETVRVGQQDGVTCWVTDIENNRTTLQGKMLEDGNLAFREPE